MIVSSPSSVALQSGACSPATTPARFTAAARAAHLQTRQQQQHEYPPGASSCSSSTTTSASFSSSAPNPSATSPRASKRSAPSYFHHSDHDSQRTSPRSRFSSQGIDELRSALKRYSVSSGTAHSPRGPSGDRPRGTMAAEPGSLEGSQNEAAAVPNDTATTVTDSISPNAPTTATATAAASSGSTRAKRHSPVERDAPVTRRSPPGAASADSEGAQSKRPRPADAPVKQLPRRYEFAHPNDLVVLISSMLMELLQYNDKIPLNEGRLTRFHSRSPPRISVRDYLQRLTTHATLSPPILLSMVYYIDRLCALYPAFTVSSLTVHRFLIASATVASKGLSDSFWTNKTYARVGGVSVAELALLELEFLWRVEWKIVPQPEVLVDYYLSLVERCDGYELEPQDSHPEGITDDDQPPPLQEE